MSDNLFESLLVQDLKISVKPEVRPGALVEDQYAIAFCSDGQTVEHVPKFLSKLTYFFIKNGGGLSVKVTGEKGVHS